MIINPPGATILEKGDIILALGNDDQLYKLKRLTKSS
jgi:Trk K+ transport system NAD-binding subunit